MVAFFSLGRFKACCHCGQVYRLVDALRLPRCTHSEPILSPNPPCSPDLYPSDWFLFPPYHSSCKEPGLRATNTTGETYHMGKGFEWLAKCVAAQMDLTDIEVPSFKSI